MKVEELYEGLLGAAMVLSYAVGGFGGLLLLQRLSQLSLSELLHPSIDLVLWAATVLTSWLLLAHCVRELDGMRRQREAHVRDYTRPPDAAGV